MSVQIHYNDVQLRVEIIALLKVSPQSQIANLGASIAQQLTRAAQTRSSAVTIMGGSVQVSDRDRGRIQDIIWDLIIEGHVRPGLGDGMNNDLPFFHVTAKGKANL